MSNRLFQSYTAKQQFLQNINIWNVLYHWESFILTLILRLNIVFANDLKSNSAIHIIFFFERTANIGQHNNTHYRPERRREMFKQTMENSQWANYTNLIL